MIPIKGYANFHPLKHCWIGSGFKAEWFKDVTKDPKILGPLTRIAEETEEDYQALEKILKDAGVKTYRSFLDINKYGSIKNIHRPPVQPRDHCATIGEKFYYVGDPQKGFNQVIDKINKEQLVQDNSTGKFVISSANLFRVGKDIFWDLHPMHVQNYYDKTLVDKYVEIFEQEGFRIHISHRGYHSDGCFAIPKPGCIVSLWGIQNYTENFPNWDVLYLPDHTWDKLSPFLQMKHKVGGHWWMKGEEHNDQLIEFVNAWLNDWVGYVEETMFDVNMLSIDENTIICNNYNKEVFAYFKKHKIEPIVFNFRHRHFWDGGVHCITQDLYREGECEDYFSQG